MIELDTIKQDWFECLTLLTAEATHILENYKNHVRVWNWLLDIPDIVLV